MTSDQKKVAIGAASGVAAMVLSIWGLTQLLPDPSATDLASRLAYAFKWDALAALPFFAMIAAVGNARFLSEAIDPTAHKESQKMVVDGRVADNTLQQLLLFVIGTATLAAGLQGSEVKIVGACAITFVVMRIAFWVGYRIHPIYRAFGFSSTAYMNAGLLAASIWFAVR